jgi:hypothetical protein
MAGLGVLPAGGSIILVLTLLRVSPPMADSALVLFCQEKPEPTEGGEFMSAYKNNKTPE